jgi:hypothetical protein
MISYEEAIDDWCDITELDANKRGPALRNRLEVDAAVYKSLLDRELLRDPESGVAYFKRELRPNLVKGTQSVFLWKCFQLFKAHRGQQDFVRWLGRFSVLRKRLAESWMDLLEPAGQNDPTFVGQVLANAAQLAARNGQQIDQAAHDALLDEIDRTRRREHGERFPLQDNLFALILTVLADLNEQQRERMTSTMALRGARIDAYTYESVRDIFIELLCAPRSSLENPSLRTGSRKKLLCHGPRRYGWYLWLLG